MTLLFHSLYPGRCAFDFEFLKVWSFKFVDVMIASMRICSAIALRWKVQEIYWWQVKIDSGNGLVLSGHRPLPEPMLTKDHDAILRQ